MRDKKTQTPVNQRIITVKNVYKKFKINFEDLVGVGSSTISGFKSDRNKPGFEILERILRICEHPETKQKISPKWLMLGEGTMWERKEEDPIAELQENYKNINKRLAELEKHIKEL